MWTVPDPRLRHQDVEKSLGGRPFVQRFGMLNIKCEFSRPDADDFFIVMKPKRHFPPFLPKFSQKGNVKKYKNNIF